MSARLAAAAYLIAMLVAVIRADRGSPLLESTTIAVLAVIHFTVGVLTGRWWALALPILALALAVPFAEPDSPAGAETPIWIGMAFKSPIAIALVLGGILAGRVIGVRTQRP